MGAQCQPEVMRFPPVLSRAHYRTNRSPRDFPEPDGLGAHASPATTEDHRELIAQARRRARTGRAASATEVMLTPAACYPLYPTATGTLPQGGRTVDLLSFVFRHEPSDDPARMQIFRMREYVRLGTPDQALEHRDRLARARPGDACARSASTCSRSSPTIRSSAAAASVMAATQREQELKYELVVPIASAEEPDRDRLVQLPPRPLRRAVRHQDGRRRGRAHRVRRLRPGARSRSRCSRRTASIPPLAARRPRRARPMTHAGPRRSIPRLLAPRDPRRERAWAETNCYVDLWVELLHALGHDPIAALPFTLAIDFEGDQWTFFKFPLRRPLRAVRPRRAGARHLAPARRARRGAGRRAARCWWSSTRSTCPIRPARPTSRARQDDDGRQRDRRRGPAPRLLPQCRLSRLHGEDFDDVLRVRGPHDPASCRRTSSS